MHMRQPVVPYISIFMDLIGILLQLFPVQNIAVSTLLIGTLKKALPVKQEVRNHQTCHNKLNQIQKKSQISGDWNPMHAQEPIAKDFLCIQSVLKQY